MVDTVACQPLPDVGQFTTIYPGWYQGRTVHIHLKVITGGTDGDSNGGGTDIHTGQLYCDDVASGYNGTITVGVTPA